MNRRGFLISTGIIAAFTSIPLVQRYMPPRPLIINNAYSLWYNRPAVAEVNGGFCIGYINSSGDVLVSEINNQLLVGRTVKLHKFEGASDHGSPSLVRVPSGKYAGHVIACFSNHSSPLYFARTAQPGLVGKWAASRVIDGGRSTYASLSALHDGKIVLMHTLQENASRYSSGEWRKVVARVSDDGGDSWSDAIQIAGRGPGTFPYSTPLSLSSTGRCAMAYAIYSAAEKRHLGLTVVVTSDAFKTKTEFPIELGSASLVDTVPFEVAWISKKTVAVSYTEMREGGRLGLSRVVVVDVENGYCLSNISIADVAVHTYAGGAALADAGRSAVYSQATGGIVIKDLLNGDVTELVSGGNFSSPSFVVVGSQRLVIALQDPSIVTTRKFSASLKIMDVGGVVG